MKTRIKPLFLRLALIAVLGLMPAGPLAAQTFTNLHTFTALSNSTNSDGSHPPAGLILSGSALFGTTKSGGANGYGTVFAVNTNGTSFRVLHSFASTSDGANPNAGLILSGGTLYGTAQQGGAHAYGTVFAVSTNGTGFTNLYSFTGGIDGANPVGTLILSSNTLYGTASYGGVNGGGANGYGTVFAVNTNGTGIMTLHAFGTVMNDGAHPQAGLLISGNILYGTASVDGPNGNGAVFAVNTDGTGYTNLFSFTGGSGGANPYAGLILSGNTLYGTTYLGGTNGNGTVFAVNTNGTSFSLLHTFSAENGAYENFDGANPSAGLILSGGMLYGTAVVGGTYANGTAGNGTVFAVSTNGTGFTNLYSFTGGSDGDEPYCQLILSGNTLYGTAYFGGSPSGGWQSGNGTVFALSLPVVASPVLTNILVSPAAPIIGVGSNQQFSATGYFSDGSSQTLTNGSAGTNLLWSSSSTNVASITTNALATGLTNGVTTITATSGSVSGNTTLTVVSPPAITQQPQNLSVWTGSPASFYVSTGGSGPFTYLWALNGTNISGATNTNYSINTVAITNGGIYTVGVTNAYGGVLSTGATLTVDYITQQPANQVVTNGGTATFSVGVAGLGPFSYQWQWNGTNMVPGVTTSNLTLTSISTNNLGNYAVVITAFAGSITSSVASLNMPAYIIQQPQNVSVFGGNATNLNVVAGGIGPFTYQWALNGANIAGATNASYALTAASITNAGNYMVAVSNMYGGVISAPASLAVFPATAVVTWPAPSAIDYGTALSSNQLDATANVPGSFAYTPTNGTVLGAGTNILTVIFTPTDTVDYSNVTDTVSLVVLLETPLQYFTYTTNAGTITITGYTGPGGAVYIPPTIYGLPVTGIGQEAFTDTAATSVTIPNTVTSIGELAFYYCTSLTNITLSASVTNIGVSAFQYCPSLTSVTIPSGVTSIGEYAFDDCTSLTAITVAANNSFYSSVNGVLFNQNQTILIQYPGGLGGGYTVPGSVTNIGASAFQYCPGLTSVTIPGSVTSLGGGVFNEPFGVYGVFANCYSLTNVTIASGLTSLGTSMFADCSSLTSVTIPASVTSLGAGAFFACSSLSSVTIPASVTSIGVSAFQSCFSLASVTIPGSLTSLGDDAFSSCQNLGSLYFQGNAPGYGYNVFAGDNKATAYYLPYTTGWSSTFAGIPAVLWNPLLQAGGANFGVRSNQFGFNVTGTTNLVVVVEACTNLANPVWTPLQTDTLTNGSFYFSEPLQTNSAARFYRLGLP